MTIRAMQRAVVIASFAALAAFSFAACGSDERPTDPGSSEDALEVAEEANDAVAELESQLEDLESDLDRANEARQSLADKFDKIHKDLRDSIANLRASLSDVTSDASSARESANSALAEVDAAMKRLSVLENRFDYHLRNDH